MRAFSCPDSQEGLDIPAWELLVRQGRRAEVLGMLASRLERAGVWDKTPNAPREHMASAVVLARRQHIELGYEVREVQAVMERAGVPCVLLKGAAYVLRGLRAAEGRVVSDVDILVPRPQLPQAESGLMKAGWQTTTTDTYDQRYYRTWMHEIPALRHVHRGSVLDVHHSVVPPTAGYSLNIDLMLEAAVPIQGMNHVLVLCDVDMVLHSAVHLMHEGELEMGFRGLLDMDALVAEFSAADAGFWDRLAARAVELHLQRPAFLALRYTQKMLGTAVSSDCLARLREESSGLGNMRLVLLDALYERGLRPDHETLDDQFSALTRWCLYMRSHWLRMPLHLLLPHLTRKWLRRMIAVNKRREELSDENA